MSTTFEVEEKTVEPLLVAAIRMQAPYSECGKAFARIGRRFGWRLCGKPALLQYDTCYQEIANFEACIPVRKGESQDGIEVRELPGGRCATLMHLGPYDQLRSSYDKIRQHMIERGYECELPTREVYHKGPGMIFKGNPQKYLTEIQMFMKKA